MRWPKLFFFFNLILISSFGMATVTADAQSLIEESSDISNTENTTSETQMNSRVVGNGTETSPLLVTNESELVEALATTPSSGDVLYIKLTSDITGVDWRNKFRFIRDTVVDGDGHSFLNSGTNYTTRQFYVENKSNMTVTYKNLNFGNAEYPNSNYYGILRTSGSSSSMANFTLNIENVNYYITNGAQPFFFGGGTNSTVNFSGENLFQMTNNRGVHGGEFSEGVQNFTFKSGSKTTISHLNEDESAFFRGDENAGKMNITVENNASLDITTVKRYLFYGANPQPQVNVGENANFKYQRVKATNSTIANTGNIGVEFNFNKNSTNILEFNGVLDTGTSSENLVMNADQPNYIIVRDTLPNNTGALFNNARTSIKFNRTDNSVNQNYNLFSFGRDNQITELMSFKPDSSYILLGSAVSSHSGVLYQESQSIRDAVVASADTSLNVSNIDVHLKKIERINRGMSKVTYKLGDSQLYNSSQSITDKLSQEKITDSVLGSKGFIGQKEVTITDSESPDFDIEQATTAQFEKLKPGTYYLYTQIDEIVGTEAGEAPVAGFNIKSKWVETIVEVPPILNVSFPVNSLAFNSYKAGEFGKSENTNGGASISSSSNVPVGVKLQTVIENDENTVKLVNEFTTQPTNELILRLNSVFESGLKGPVWGPLADNNIEDEKKVLTFQPFWGNNKEATLFLDGNFSGPSHVEQKVKYQFIFYYEDLSE